MVLANAPPEAAPAVRRLAWLSLGAPIYERTMATGSRLRGLL